MTLSGDRDRDARKAEAREAWKAKHDAQVSRRPWVMPLMIGIAVAVVLGAVFATSLLGFDLWSR
jgi:hypothetical protein